jgi:hypothetical protein
VIRPTTPVLVLVTAAAVLLGCGSTTPGEGAADAANPVPSFTERPTIGPSSAPGLDAVTPCDLLEQSERATLNLGAGQGRTHEGRRICAFPATDESYVVAVSLWPEEGLDTITPDTILGGPTTLGRHNVVQHHENNKTACVFSIGIGESSSVDVGATFAKPVKDITPDEFDQSCALAQRAAEFVEPGLP